MCTNPECKHKKGHTKYACHRLHPELKRQSKFFAKKRFKQRPKAREPSLDKGGKKKSDFGRKGF